MRKLIFPTSLFALFSILLVLGCTPKTTATVTPPTTAPAPKPVSPAPEPVKLSPCPKFSDAPNPDDAETNYVLYRDFLRAKDYDKAHAYWQKVYAVAPAADGQRNTVFSDGILFYEHFLAQTGNQAYVDSIFQMYDHIHECYPEGGYVAGRKAFDYYYKYPERSTPLATYKLFKESIDLDGIKANDFVINPFTALLTELHDSMLVSDAEAKAYVGKIKAIIANGLATCEEPYCERWRIVAEYAPVRLEYFETVQGFYDCDYYIKKYYPAFTENPTDCDNAREVFSSLTWGGCTAGQPEYDAVKAVIDGNDCRFQFTGPAGIGVECLQNANYNCAIENLLLAADQETESIRKSELLLLVAKIYYVHKRNFSQARNYAQQAADVRPNWGVPYILIGRMYASSGPLCGPGRGWDSQVVVWAALDAWSRAKSIDSRSAGEAQRWINQYSQYMPKREDIFLRGLKVGDTYNIGCWIQRSTTIRTAN
ncbi:MAG: hypothetical protein DA408_01775 [Bacteroidetes bacterium]|nr:MAG: hypothetical protein C7N36_16505 [Bacteroidota bacterium]PTM14770.1 MAG: hypothetical protein DA408_01775 [Bacteroidota bacterium]